MKRGCSGWHFVIRFSEDRHYKKVGIEMKFLVLKTNKAMSQKSFTRLMSFAFLALGLVYMIGHYAQSEGTILSTDMPSWATALIVFASGFVMYFVKHMARKEAGAKVSKDA
jgi:hypothetical protein